MEPVTLSLETSLNLIPKFYGCNLQVILSSVVKKYTKKMKIL